MLSLHHTWPAGITSYLTFDLNHVVILTGSWYKMEVCVICQQPLGKCHNEAQWVYRQPCYLVGDLPSATLAEKGCASIKNTSEEREDADAIQPFPEERVHRDCRRNYCKPDQIAKISRIKQGMIGEAAFERPALRSDDDKFSFKSNFFFVVSWLWLETRKKILM